MMSTNLSKLTCRAGEFNTGSLILSVHRGENTQGFITFSFLMLYILILDKTFFTFSFRMLYILILDLNYALIVYSSSQWLIEQALVTSATDSDLVTSTILSLIIATRHLIDLIWNSDVLWHTKSRWGNFQVGNAVGFVNSTPYSFFPCPFWLRIFIGF